MPSQKPRVAMILPDPTRRALFALAAALERPAATLAAELLTEMVPQMEGLTKYAIAMKAGKSKAAKQAMAHMMGDAFADAMSASQPELFEAGKAKGKAKR